MITPVPQESRLRTTSYGLRIETLRLGSDQSGSVCSLVGPMRRDLCWTTQGARVEDAMTAAHNIDLPPVLAERLTTTHTAVLRELLADARHVHPHLDGTLKPTPSAVPDTASAALSAPTLATGTGSANSALAQGHWIWRSPSCAKAPTRRTGCWNAANAPSGPDDGWSRPATYLLGPHPADEQARRNPRHHRPVEVAGLSDGQGTRRRGRGVPQPPAPT